MVNSKSKFKQATFQILIRQLLFRTMNQTTHQYYKTQTRNKPSASVIRMSAIRQSYGKSSSMVCQDTVSHVYTIHIIFTNKTSVWWCSCALEAITQCRKNCLQILEGNNLTAIYSNTSEPDQMNLLLTLLDTTSCQKDHF
jgi:hypothetical protein